MNGSHRLTVTVMDDLANNKTTASFDADGNSGDAWPSGDACDDESEVRANDWMCVIPGIRSVILSV